MDNIATSNAQGKKMNKQEIQRTVDYLYLQIDRVWEEIYDCQRGRDYGRGHAEQALREWVRDLENEYQLYVAMLELTIRGE